MAPSEFGKTVSTNLDRSSTICVECGNAAEICLLTLKGASQGSNCFCLACGEAYMHNLLHQRAAYDRAAHVVAETGHTSLSHKPISHDEADGGIIFWEGHGWSSDGPFAGA